VPELEQVLPKYRQIAHYYRDQILRGDLRPGDEVPSERAIATSFSVARPTATKALEILRREGLVRSVQGAGTYVADPKINRRARDRYQRSREQGRIYPPDEYAVIVSADIVPSAPEHVCAALGLTAGSAAIRRHRITHDTDGPRELSTSWFPGDLASVAQRLLVPERIVEGTLSYVESVTGRTGAYARDRATARFATVGEAGELALASGAQTPVLSIEHTVLDQSDQPIEFAEAIYPPGRWTYEQHYDL
jgi:DNA-binding GntR family transcriptional regulator